MRSPSALRAKIADVPDLAGPSPELTDAWSRIAAFAAEGLQVEPSAAEVSVAVIIPCYNEEASIEAVLRDFSAHLPAARLYVYDNSSTDRTREVAATAGAKVRTAPLRGKGNVVRQMFADVEADVYVLVDGDGTYDAAAAPRLVETLVDEGLDMVTGARIQTQAAAYRPGHVFGNRLLTGLVRWTFGCTVRDMLSGYRVFSRRFVKSFPASSAGFEIETELTVHALQMRLPQVEIDTAYGQRDEGSVSKLSTWKDGFRIICMVGLLLREEKPLQFFSLCALALFGVALGLGVPVVAEYFATGFVPKFPTLIVATGLGVTGLLSLACGLILESVARGRLETRRFAYLAARPVGSR